jgi:hypothetical protein
MKEYLYRYQESFDEEGVETKLIKYLITKRTPQGAWIDLYSYDKNGLYLYDEKENKKFILLTARKRFACPTIEEAEESFFARKNCQLKILKAQINNVQCAITSLKEKRPVAYHLSLFLES